MKKYLLKQKLYVNDEEKANSKNADIQLYISENGMDQQQIAKLFNSMASQIVKLIESETMESNVRFDKLQQFDDINGGKGYEAKF